MNVSASSAAGKWAHSWPDLVAFAMGLAVAWFAGWNTTDLVWSLWLSSLVVGYGMIVWSLTRPMREIAVGVVRDRSWSGILPALGAIAVLGFGVSLLLVFFTVHFGGFHYVHSVFLGTFFPVDGVPAESGVSFVPAIYTEIAARYWWFLPAAFLAERDAFRPRPPEVPDTAVTAAAIEARKRRGPKSGDPIMGPYKNVIRMHLMIFFFAFAHMMKLENFAIYSVVYAVYFFPWRLLGRRAAVSNQPQAMGGKP